MISVIDKLGRLLIPKDIRRTYNIKGKTIIYLGEYRENIVWCKSKDQDKMKDKFKEIETILVSVDLSGRFVIPVFFRKKYNFRSGDKLDINTINGTEIFTIKKHLHECIYCGTNDSLIEINNRYICTSCLDKIRDIIC